MRIGIDARLFGSENSGLGRYVDKLIEHLQKIDKINHYVLFVRAGHLEDLKITNSNFSKVVVDVRHYSPKEQAVMPSALRGRNLDLLHVPHFNIPVFYRGKTVVTIHDLIKSEFASSSASTKKPIIYWLKHHAYEMVIREAVRRSKKIITPTNVIKSKLVDSLGADPSKIVVTYEAADDKFLEWGEKSIRPSELKRVLDSYKIKKPFVIYVGNSYPYKNVERVLEALRYLPTELSFVNPSARSIFYEKLGTRVKEMGLNGRVILPGFVPDEDLAVLYRSAEAYVFPSYSEGFGIPALEAMASKLPVICSDIPVLREVCGDNALFFNPDSAKELAGKIEIVKNDKILRERLIKEGLERVKQFSWAKMAAQTLSVYEEAVK